MKITAVLLKLGQTRIIIGPMSPKITEQREKREREREREKKRLSTVFSFYSVDFGDKKPVPKVTQRPFLRATWFLSFIFFFWLNSFLFQFSTDYVQIEQKQSM